MREVSGNQASESKQIRVTMVFFHPLLSNNFDDELSSKFQRFVEIHASEKTGR